MTTSEPGDLPELPDGRPESMPDPAVLARMASEMFAAMPSAPALNGSAPSIGPAMPTEAGLRALPSTLGVPATLPALPGAAFSFLDEARAFGAPATLPAAPTLGTIKIPTETDVAAYESLLPGALPKQADVPMTDIQAPALPGSEDMQGMDFGFLETARPLGPIKDLSLTRPPVPAAGTGFYDIEAIRRDFPILQEKINGRRLVWLDNAATTQKPNAVIERLSHYYKHENSNIHRAAHELAARATDAYEAARESTRRFLNADSSKDIVFVRGATEAINLVAQSWGERNIEKGDEIVITWLEHHANIVPWQMLAAKKGARLRVAPVDDDGQVLLDEYEKLFTSRTKLASIAHVSNARGRVNRVKEMLAVAQRRGATTMVDGAQAVSHMAVDVQDLDCDFYVFSGHKLYAPTGIGALYGKPDVLAAMPPWHGGGNMISDVTFEKTLYQAPPQRFEAGTGNIADAIGLGAAIDYLEKLGMANVARHEHELLAYATEKMKRIPGLRLIGTAKEKAGVLSFVLDGFRTEDVGAALNKEGIAVRSGHHCAQPILRRMGVESTVRPSLGVYNGKDDIDALVAAIWNLKNARGAGPL